jgi:hypothetical protein
MVVDFMGRLWSAGVSVLIDLANFLTACKWGTDCQVSASFEFFSLKFERGALWAQPDGTKAASSLSPGREAAVVPG